MTWEPEGRSGFSWEEAERQASESNPLSPNGSDELLRCPKSFDAAPLEASKAPRPVRSTPELESAWIALESVFHPLIEFQTERHKALGIYCRAMSLRNVLRNQSMLIRYDDGSTILYSPHELPVVPIGGQGLTDNELAECAKAGQLMSEIFAEEGRRGPK